MSVHVARFDDLDWTSPAIPDDLPPELRERAAAVRRKGLAAGEAGFFASHVAMQAGQVTVPHSHDHDELMVVLDGSMTFDDGTGPVTVHRNDAVAVPAGQVYGFEVGADGVRFLLVRTAKARSTLAGPAPGGVG